jgi:glutaredoxin
LDVVILTKTDCHFCEMATEILGSLESEFNLEIRRVDLSSQEGNLIAQKVRLPIPPGILIDDELFSYGRPSERRLRREFGKRLGRITK